MILARAKEFIRRFFWPSYNTNGSRMKWDQTDFSHLFIPVDESPTLWDERRVLAFSPGSSTRAQALFVPFSSFVRLYDDIFVVSGMGFTGKYYQFTQM